MFQNKKGWQVVISKYYSAWRNVIYIPCYKFLLIIKHAQSFATVQVPFGSSWCHSFSSHPSLHIIWTSKILADWNLPYSSSTMEHKRCSESQISFSVFASILNKMEIWWIDEYNLTNDISWKYLTDCKDVFFSNFIQLSAPSSSWKYLPKTGLKLHSTLKTFQVFSTVDIIDIILLSSSPKEDDETMTYCLCLKVISYDMCIN